MINNAILKNCHREGFNDGEVYDAYKIFFGTLVSEPRLKIINLLRKRSMSVSEIIAALDADQTAVSHDLARLKKCGFVRSTVEGKYRNYALNETTIKPLMELIESHMAQHCVHILRASNGGSHDE